MLLVIVLVLAVEHYRDRFQPGEFNNVPEELSNCKFYWLTDTNKNSMVVAKCSGSTDTLLHMNNRIVIDPDDTPDDGTRGGK